MNPRECDAILVPVDFSDVAGYSIDHATAIAKIFGYRVFLLNVISKRQKGSDKEAEVEKRLIDLSKSLMSDHGLKVTHLVRAGDVNRTINQVADKLHAAFIVMGVHGKKGIEHLTGSYPYKVVCRSNVPVLVVKDKHHHVGFHNIVIPIDFSKRTTQKITQAIRFSKFFGASIRVFGFLSSGNKAKIINKEALLKSITDIFEENGVNVTTDLMVNPDYSWPEALMHFSESVKADLIMIVAERGSRIQDIFSQNYTEKILDKVDAPVLTIMPGDEDTDTEKESSSEDFVTPFVDPFGLIADPGN